MNKIFHGTVIGVFALAFTGLIYAETPISEEAMLIKASQLTKLSTAAESAVRYKNPPADLDETGLLSFSSQHDPQLLQNFSGFKTRILARDKHAVLLICSADGQRALLEDAGCTEKLDEQLWRAAPAKPCEFTLNVAAVCSVPDALASAEGSPAQTPPAAAPETAMIEIAAIAWAGEIDKNSRQPASTLAQARAHQRLALWMQVKGSAAAMEKLAAEGKLPIRHKWFRETISRVEAQGVTSMTDQIDIPVAQRGLLPKLKQELRERGYFDWRTWSYKDNVRGGAWRVRVVYADNSPVLCGAKGERRPCEYSIEVR